MSSSQDQNLRDKDRSSRHERRPDDRGDRHHRSHEDRERRPHREDRDRRHRDDRDDRHRHREDRDRRPRDGDSHRRHRSERDSERGHKRSRSPADRRSHDDRSSRRDDDRDSRHHHDDSHRSSKISSKFGERIDPSTIDVSSYQGYGAEPPSFPGGIDQAAIAKIMGLSGDYGPSPPSSSAAPAPVPPPADPMPMTDILDEEVDHDLNDIHQDSYFNVDAPPTQILTPISIKVGGVKMSLPPNTEKYFVVKRAEELTEEERGAMVLHQGSGALVNMEGGFNLSSIIPMVSSELARVARENRRLHVSGFPRGINKQDLDVLFADWGQTFRRKLTATQMKRQGKAEEAEKLPPDAIFSIDKVLEVFLDETKDKPFSFVEFNNDDICDIFIEHGDGETVELTLRDGRSYPLKINRPRDYSAIFKTDDFRILIQGIPSVLTERNVRQLVESAKAKVTDFQMKDGVAYVEFEDDEEASETMRFLNGLVIRNHVLVCSLLTDVMRAYWVQQGLRISARPDDGTEDAIAQIEEGDVLAEILQLQGMLPQTLSRLHRYYPHLKPIMGLQPPVYPTRILVLLNIVDELDLENDDVYAELKARILGEAAKYGAVKRLIVPRYEAKPTPPPLYVPAPLTKPVLRAAGRYPGAAQEDAAELAAYEDAVATQQEEIAAYEQAKKDFHTNTDTWKSNQQHPVFGYGIGKVFIEYENLKGAELGQRNMSGRLFCNRTVVTSFLFEDILYPELMEEKAKEVAAAEEDAIVEDAPSPHNDEVVAAEDETVTTTVTEVD